MNATCEPADKTLDVLPQGGFEAAQMCDWNDLDKKSEAVYKVLRYLAEHPEEGLDCIGNDEKARQLFSEKGGIEVPTGQGARVIFFASGEQALEHGGSVIIEVPSKAVPDATDEQLKGYILGNYPYWPLV